MCYGPPIGTVRIGGEDSTASFVSSHKCNSLSIW